MNWFQANQFCREQGMFLTTMNSAREYIELADKIKSTCQIERGRYWIGLNVVEHLQNPYIDSDAWRGVNAEPINPNDFSAIWLPYPADPNPSRGVFNNCPGITLESCAEIYVHSTVKVHGKLNDRNCYVKTSEFICTKRYYVKK